MNEKVWVMSNTEKLFQSSSIVSELLNRQSNKSAQVVCVYLAKEDEVNMDEYIEKCLIQWKTVICPSAWKDIVLRRLDYLEDMSIWKYAVRYPQWDVYTWPIDLIIVPGRAFTKDWKRLGRGGWWYDRLLAKHPHAYSIGVCFEQQVVDDIPMNEWDRNVDEIIHW